MAVPPTSLVPATLSGRPEDPTVVIIYDLLIIIGFIVCTAVLLTAVISRRIIRSRPWYIFMGFSSWWAIQHQLLVGNQLTLVPPPHPLCLLQSSFIYAAPPAITFSLIFVH
ncbi:hypothetical protein DL96DRAFT_877509 [Flagelloscypha sp. PMI_526]|nr:hypothetical protein DL96DRAFT_877509 [Flagelloscypha sp. PMI_526]